MGFEGHWIGREAPSLKKKETEERTRGKRVEIKRESRGLESLVSLTTFSFEVTLDARLRPGVVRFAQREILPPDS